MKDRKLRIAVLPERVSPIPLKKVFVDVGIPACSIIELGSIADVDFSKIDVIVITMDVTLFPGYFSGKKIRKIVDFVRKGGICWVLHQEREGYDLSWLPRELSDNMRIEPRYHSTVFNFRGTGPGVFTNQLCPWILDRNHPLWNKPNYLDESDFVEWNVKILKMKFRSVALNAIIRQKGWDVHAAYEDYETSKKDGAALVMESRFGKGLYLWTQLFSPGLVWGGKGSREKAAWGKLVQNIYQYLGDFKSNSIIKVKTTVKPWGVMAGSPVFVSLDLPPQFTPVRLDMEVTAPGGAVKKTESQPLKVAKGRITVRHVPEMAGDHDLMIKVLSRDGREAIAHEHFKVTKGVTPYRFTNHHHYMIAWGPSSLAGIFASARRWNVDAVFLASGQFYHSEDMFRRTDSKTLKSIDNPMMRIFPGQEVHPHHPYGLDEGAVDLDEDVRHHATTMGCHTIKPENWDYWDPSTIRKAHEQGGIVVVAHHQRGDKWWLKKYQGHYFDAVSFDHVEHGYWDNILKKGRLLPGIRGTDSGFGPFGNIANTVWMREPFTMPNLLKSCINGRVTFIDMDTSQIGSKNSSIWFDINNELVGGTLYAVDRINLHLKIDAHLVMKTIRIVKFGNREYRTLKADGRKFEVNIREAAEDFTYFRVEAYAKERDEMDLNRREFAAAVTNPIYVRKIKGPTGGYFYFDKDAGIYLDKKEGRFIPRTAKVIDTGHKSGVWRITIQEPEDKGGLAIGGSSGSNVSIDGKEIAVIRNEHGEVLVRYGHGRHVIIVGG